MVMCLIPQGTVDYNVVPDCLAGSRALTSQQFQTIDSLIALFLTGISNCEW